MKNIYKINFCKTKCEYFGQISFFETNFQIIFCPHAARALPIKKSSGMGRSGPWILRWRAGKSWHGRAR